MMSKHAFLFLVRQIDAQTLGVMQALDDPQHDFYVHVDAKSGPIDEVAIHQSLHDSSVVIVPRVSVGWAAYSMVEAELSLLRTAAQAATQYAYYHLVSESDFPLVSNQALQAFFATQETEFVELERVNDSNTINRVKYYYPLQEHLGKRHGLPWLMQKGLLGLERVARIDRLKRQTAVETIAKGSQWFSITDDFAQYVVANAALVEQLCRASRAPDEVFLQTLLLNSKFAKRVAPPTLSNLRYIRWAKGNSPQLLGPQDYPELVESGKLFARKITGDAEGQALRHLILETKDGSNS